MVQCAYHPTTRCCSSCLHRYDSASTSAGPPSWPSSSPTITSPSSSPVRTTAGGPPSRQSLSTCPECHSVCCATDLMWCVGHPGAAGHANPRPAACGVCYARKLDVRERVRLCVNDGCWSNDDRYRKAVAALCVCADCAHAGPGSGPDSAEAKSNFGPCECVCGRTWLCGMCSGDPDVWAGHFSTCPRCKQLTCLVHAACGGAIPCEGCQRPRLCDDCIEVEADDGDEVRGSSDEAPARMMGVCEGCNAKMCDSCAHRTRTKGKGWVSQVGRCPECQEVIDRSNMGGFWHRMTRG